MSRIGFIGTGHIAAPMEEAYVANLISGLLYNIDKSEPGYLARARAALASPKTLNLQMVDGLKSHGAFDGLPDLLGRISASMEREE